MIGHQSLRAALPGLDSTSLIYGIPFASGALITQAVLGLHYGLVFSILMTLTTVVYFPHEPVLPVYVLVVNLIAVMSLSRTRSRSAYLRAGLNIGLFSIPLVVGSLMIEPHATATAYVVRPVIGILGGIVGAIIASGVIPLIEHFGGYITRPPTD